MQDIDLELLLKLNKPIPRYTSYPTAPEWGELSESVYEEKLHGLARNDHPLSLYFHIPFCKTMCLYCACSVVLNRKPENEERYVSYLLREIDLVRKKIGVRKKIRQLHFGGGTPTKLSVEQFETLFAKIKDAFEIEKDAEVAIEIDPRTVHEDEGKKLVSLRAMGFNRVSFGVQDVDPKVQEAVKRRQSYEVTRDTYYHAKTLGFSSINIDLIYGLPYQTYETFKETIHKIIDLAPDRIALFSYAKVPWLKPHQKAIKDETLPTTEEKFRIYLFARRALVEAGFKAIGMDHFANNGDELAIAFNKKTLQRNFQGYTVFDVEDLLGFGVTSIGYVQGSYVQNNKELDEYYSAIDDERLPLCRGRVLNEDDHIRRFVIQRLMCRFSVDKEEFYTRFTKQFNDYFAQEFELLQPLFADGLVADCKNELVVTTKGELFVRNIASSFDKYLRKDEPGRFSQSI
jgi:oxygen-independent coproporphyrinogen III oxidase